MRFISSLAIIALLVKESLASPAGTFDLALESNVALGRRLIQTSEDQPPFWITENEKLNFLKRRTDFLGALLTDAIPKFDLTESYQREQLLKSSSAKAKLTVTYPAPSHQTEVKRLIPLLSIVNMESYLSNLISFQNRYYKSEYGLAASNYIYDTLSGLAHGKEGVYVTKVSHSFIQHSIIAQIAGSSNASSIVILGAHEDSILPKDRMNGRSPGADDNGTGVMNVMEVFRVLVESRFKPTRTVEFHFYAGEEEGLFGSQAIALDYRAMGKSVYGMLNLDMTGYFKPGTEESIALVTDYTDLPLTTYVETLINTYSGIPASTYLCGYACSDHASWHRNGFPAACPFEAPNGNSNENLHTTQDTTSVDGFSFEHSLEFAKLALTFVVELGLKG
ncbi:hypothetical protein B0J17DRAFT_725597 [Rhizoctonia solani]|nr:hypothetical protein B0J17DRAFT_725597 [Rhizoctonia solani]